MARRIRRELDEAITHLEGGASDRDLLSIVCHDLKDPLASIVMGAGFLKKTVATEDGSARRVVEAIARSADRMTQVVGDFHDLARLEAGTLAIERRPCDVVAAAGVAIDASAPQAVEQGIELVQDLPGEPVMASCDRARLTQMTAKLLANALRFTPKGGKVIVRARGVGPEAILSVSDTGRGIEPERLPTIFDRAANARRTPRDGPGLGLAIVRALAEAQGGRVTVESRLGEGSTFTVALPRA